MDGQGAPHRPTLSPWLREAVYLGHEASYGLKVKMYPYFWVFAPLFRNAQEAFTFREAPVIFTWGSASWNTVCSVVRLPWSAPLWQKLWIRQSLM